MAMSTEKSTAQQPRTCKYFLETRQCPYGKRCRYRHSFLGEQKIPADVAGGMDHVSTNSGLLDLSSFPSLSNSANDRQRVALPVRSESVQREASVRRVQVKSGGPPELTLGAFFMRTSSSSARLVIERPSANRSDEDLREIEIQQIKARFPGDLCQLVERSKEKSVYRVKISPTDPKWIFSFKTIDLLIAFPLSYPKSMFSVDVPIDQALPPDAVACVKSAVLEYAEKYAHRDRDLPFRPFLHWLDQNLYSIVSSAVKQDEWTLDFNEGSDEALSQGQEVVDPVPVKRGTEFRFDNLQLSVSTGTVTLETVKVVFQCGRCKGKLTEPLKAGVSTSVSCTRCQSVSVATYHPAILFASSPTAGYLDVHGCTCIDVVLQDCIMVITCLECGKSVRHTGMLLGDKKDGCCQRCHAKLSVVPGQCRFVEHQTVPVAIVPATRKPQKTCGIQPGKALPNYGSCVHYKKSFRWLRFPCCGKVYPCDVCHDTNEDHIMERAKRMICGYCSTEQPYTVSDPCRRCGGDLTHTKHTAFWEGGHGCRNKVKMSRKDKHKYTST